VGGRTVFAGSGPLLYLVAYQYMKAGAIVAAVVDTAPGSSKRKAAFHFSRFPVPFAKGLWFIAALRASGVPIHHSAGSPCVEGDGRVEAFSFMDSRGEHR